MYIAKSEVYYTSAAALGDVEEKAAHCSALIKWIEVNR